MKELRKYLKFDHKTFFENKELAFVDGKLSAPTKEHPDAFKGVVIDIVIMVDPTGVNEFDKFRVKVPDADEAYLDQFKPHDPVTLTDIQKASVYGQYQNELSIVGRVNKIVKK